MTDKRHELKPCPVCNGKGDFFTYHPSNPTLDMAITVECNKCSYNITAFVSSADCEDEDIDNISAFVYSEWNKGKPLSASNDNSAMRAINQHITNELHLLKAAANNIAGAVDSYGNKGQHNDANVAVRHLLAINSATIALQSLKHELKAMG